MKKAILLSGLVAMTVLPALASDMLPAGGYYETTVTDCNPAAMRRALDAATHSRRAVVTVVRCDNDAAKTVDSDSAAKLGNLGALTAGGVVETPAVPVQYAEPRARCANSVAPVERVVARRYYVTETVMRYTPVVTYVPDGTYTRTHTICDMCDR